MARKDEQSALVGQLVATAAADGIRQLVVTAVVTRRGTVLLLRRAVDPFPDGPCHELPSGLVSPGETLHDALVRVVAVVTGLDVETVGAFLGRSDFDAGDGTPTRQFIFAVDVVADEPVRLTRHIGYRWAARTEDLDVNESVRAILAGRP